MKRRPVALTNWKMSMTIPESLTFMEDFQALAGDALDKVDVIVCPPYTSLWAMAQKWPTGSVVWGAQNVCEADEVARTGQISAALLADAGCRYVMIGHWEIQHRMHEDDHTLNRKIHRALAAGIIPVIFVGEGRTEIDDPDALERHLAAFLAGCTTEQVAPMVFVYEPEASIGVARPSTPEMISRGCHIIRSYVAEHFGPEAGESIRIIYGGSVSPDSAGELLEVPDIDGLGATRRGRVADSFAEIVSQVATLAGKRG